MGLISVECSECGSEYDPEEGDTASDHDPDCAIREAMIARGRWEDPDQ